VALEGRHVEIWGSFAVAYGHRAREVSILCSAEYPGFGAPWYQFGHEERETDPRPGLVQP
jgi:hypothetical protein